MGVSKINSNRVIRNDLPLTRITKNLGKLKTTASCNVSHQPHSKAVPLSLRAEVQPYTPSRGDTPSTVPLSHRADPFVPSVIVTSVPRPRYHQHDNDPDRLDGLVEELSHQYVTSDSYGNFIRDVRGRGDLHPEVGSLPHPAAHLLSHFQKVGTPAIINAKPWTPSRLEATLKRGPHSSCSDGIEFLREEFADMIEKQQWIVLPADLVKKQFGLRLSPLGLVPQRGRRDRMISDYSFFDVNQETLKLAPDEAMQFGRTLWRLLYRIHHANDKFGPVFLSKVDLSDGFYRLWLRPEDTIHLAALFPSRPGEPKLVGIPLTNPMGWVSSPPNFSACTETIADLANVDLADPIAIEEARSTPHRLDVVSESNPTPSASSNSTDQLLSLPTSSSAPPSTSKPFLRPLQYWDIYVDDFCGLVQGNKWKRRTVKRILFNALDKVFRPLDGDDTMFRQEPASLKKLRKGDARWDTEKIILGWLLDTINKTISLPPHRAERLHEILNSITTDQRWIATKDWHKVIGELRSMSVALPGCTGLFSILQEAFRHEEQGRERLRLTKTLHGFLDDFRLLAQELTSRPTRIAELIPDREPRTEGACDAAGSGMGGVHFIPASTDAGDEDVVPLLWRERFPQWVRDQLSCWKNPNGRITNSDLELAGSIAQNDVLAQYANVAERTTHNCYDNIPAVYWQRKGATTTIGPAAYLLRLQGIHQRLYRYVPLRDYIPGFLNEMADILSRRWDLSDDQLLAYFNTHFPQKRPWRLCPLRPEMNSWLTSALSRRRSVPELFQPTPSKRMDIGTFGWSTAEPINSTLSFTGLKIKSRSSKSSAVDSASAKLLPAASASCLNQFRTRSVRWARGSPYWGPMIPATPLMEKLISV